MRRISTVLYLMWAVTVQAEDYQQLAYGADLHSAQANAQAQLAAMLQPLLHQQLCPGLEPLLCEHRWHDEALPLLGLEFTPLAAVKGQAGVRLDWQAAKALPLYRAAIQADKQRLESRRQRLRSVQDQRQQFDLLRQHLTELRHYAQMLAMSVLLGGQTEVPVWAEIASTGQALVNLETAAASFTEVISRIQWEVAAALPQESERRRIMVYPNLLLGAAEITPFAAVLREALSRSLQTTPDATQPYGLSGLYRLLSDGQMQLQLDLARHHGGIVRSYVLNLTSAAFKDTRAQVNAAEFDQLVQAAGPQRGAFRASITTHLGTKNLIFKPGENLELRVRLNQPGYFYIVGHIKREAKEYSYLVDMGEGKLQFIKKVTAAEVNHDLSLGWFQVEPPLGTEYLQLIATTVNPERQLPKTRWDAAFGYHVLDGSRGNASAAVQAVRGLSRDSTCAPAARGLARDDNTCHPATGGTAGSATTPINPTQFAENTLIYTTLAATVACQAVRGLARDCKPQPNVNGCDYPAAKLRGLSRDCK